MVKQREDSFDGQHLLNKRSGRAKPVSVGRGFEIAKNLRYIEADIKFTGGQIQADPKLRHLSSSFHGSGSGNTGCYKHHKLQALGK